MAMKKFHVARNIKDTKSYCGRHLIAGKTVFWNIGGVPYVMTDPGSVMISIDRICERCMQIMGVDYK